MQEPRERSDIPIRYTWDFAAIYPSDTEWSEEIETVAKLLESCEMFQGRLGESPDVLSVWLARADDISLRLDKIYVYASSQHSVDMRDQQAAANYSKAIGVYAQAQGATAFAEPEMLAIGVDTLLRWAEEEPRLEIYRHRFDELGRIAPHVRSPEVEELLGRVSDPFSTATNTHSILADADLTFAPAHSTAQPGDPVSISQGSVDALLMSSDRELRRTSWESYQDAHLSLKNTMANCLSTGVKQNAFRAGARRYPSALEAALSRNHIPTEVYHNVLDTFVRNLPVWHRYWRVRRRALGYETLYTYDIKAPLVDESPEVAFAQAVDWVSEGVTPLGQSYVDTMCRGVLQERWVDVYPSNGKTSGAFSSGSKGTSPLVLMSYTGDLESLSTLAHELGHSMHSYLSWETQPIVYSDYSIFVAEVASNLNQALVRDYLFRTHSERDFQIALIEEAMSNFHRYLFLMPTLARFELAIHREVERGGALTADGMIAMLAELFEEAYGGEVEIDHDRVGITWAAFHTHLYANFYVYQYTTGIAAAQALAAGILGGRQDDIANYLAFLSAGGSLYPLEALRLAGVDLSAPEPVQMAYDYLSGLVDRLEALL